MVESQRQFAPAHGLSQQFDGFVAVAFVGLERGQIDPVKFDSFGLFGRSARHSER